MPHSYAITRLRMLRHDTYCRHAAIAYAALAAAAITHRLLLDIRFH